MDSGSVVDKFTNLSVAELPQNASSLDFLFRVGFVVLTSVGAHPRAQLMAPTDERTTKPDQLVNAPHNTSGFAVQIPEGLRAKDLQR